MDEKCYNFILQNQQMFENKPKKSVNIRSVTSKSNSKSKPKKKQLIEIIYTDTTGLKTQKSKSLSRQKLQLRRSIDISKITNKNLSHKSPSQTNRHKENLYDKIQSNRTKRQNFHKNISNQKAVQLKWNKKHSHPKKQDALSTEKYKRKWDSASIPMNSEFVAVQYPHLLTSYEQKQIKEYKKIYYIGHNAKKSDKVELSEVNFDNQEKQYHIVLHDHIAYRYEIIGQIGKGSYGQVLFVYDHKKKQEVALKMIKNRQKFAKQAFVEIQILTKIKEEDPENCSNIIKIKDFVIFRKHVCLIFERMSENLYELIVRNNYNGLNLDLIRRFAIQILAALEFLRKQKIIHCDLKPENILLKDYHRSGIKVIDFGSSCFEEETIYTYIQSRYYRAPEITLGLQYDTKIDMWSTGCILGELYTGVPLFPGSNQLEQMKYFIDTLGPPPNHMVQLGSRNDVFFNQNSQLKQEIRGQKTIDYFSKKLTERIANDAFREFVELFLKWDPQQRITPRQALRSNWIRDGIPQHLRDDDMFYQQKSSREEGTKQGCKTARVSHNGGLSHIIRHSKSKSRQKKVKLSVPSIKFGRGNKN